jgi:hypothetical protein
MNRALILLGGAALAITGVVIYQAATRPAPYRYTLAGDGTLRGVATEFGLARPELGYR